MIGVIISVILLSICFKFVPPDRMTCADANIGEDPSLGGSYCHSYHSPLNEIIPLLKNTLLFGYPIYLIIRLIIWAVRTLKQKER